MTKWIKCAMASKINGNKSKVCYCGQISSQSAAVNCSFLSIWHLWGNIYFAGDGTT